MPPWRRTPVEQIRISRRAYQGHVFIGVRIYDQVDTGEWRPTRRGITLGPDLLDDFKAAITGVTLDDTPPSRRAGRR